MDKAKILERIASLKAKTPENGCTEAEATLAFEKANELMQKYSITEDELKAADIKKDFKHGTHTFKQKQIHPASKYCGRAIGEFCGVFTWMDYDYSVGKSMGASFGLHADVEMWHFLMMLVHDSMDRGWKEYLKENPSTGKRHKEYWSYMLGFAERINYKLHSLTEERYRDQDKTAKSTGKDLKVSSKAIAVKKREICKANAEIALGMEFSSSTSTTRSVVGNAYDKGDAAGSKVNLNRPLNAAGSVKQIAA